MPRTSTTTTSGPHGDPLEAIVAALTTGGPRPAGKLADQMGIPYSTLTPRLRQLEADGRAERFTDPDTRVTVWQATAPAPGSQPGNPAPDSDPVPDSDAPAGDQVAAATGDDSVTPPAEPSPEGVDPAPEDGPPPAAAEAGASGGAAGRRRKGAIPAAILEVTRARPDATFKVSQLQKALDGISAGAIANAAAKLVVAGELHLVCEKPATFQAA